MYLYVNTSPPRPGSLHSGFLTARGAVYLFGDNAMGQLGLGHCQGLEESSAKAGGGGGHGSFGCLLQGNFVSRTPPIPRPAPFLNKQIATRRIGR